MYIMGVAFADKYSASHFMFGVVFYHLGVDFVVASVLHAIFEYLENSDWGIYTIQRFFNNKWLRWIGGKTHPDSILNSVGDQFFFMSGWIVASKLQYK